MNARCVRGAHEPFAPISASLLHRIGSCYDGDYHGWSLSLGLRAGARLLSELGWNRGDITLPGGRFRNDLVAIQVSYPFTSLASLQGLIQYKRQASTFSLNLRLALLNRSGTGCFLMQTIGAIPHQSRPTNYWADLS